MSKAPKLRFKEFSGDWQEKKLGELGEFKKTYSFSRNVEGEGNYKHIHYGDIHMNYKGIISKDKYIPSIDIPSDDSYEFIKERDIIFADASEDRKDLGKVAVVRDIEGNVLSGLHTICFRPNETLNSEFFLNHSLNKEYLKFMYTRGNGAKVLGISKSNLSEYKFLAPSKEEQEKIASFFSLIDDKISLQDEKVEALKDYKKGMMQKIFSRELRFKDDSRIDYPEWKCMKLEDILTIPEKIKEENISKDKLLTVKLHRKGVHVNENTETLSIGSTVYYKRKAGQIIYGKQNFFNGAIAIIPKKFDGFISSGDVPALDVNNNVADSVYILNFIGRDTFYKRTEALATGTGSKRLHENILLDISIELPCIDEQKKIVDLLNKINEKLEKEQEKLDSLNEYKKGLLQQMFV